MKGFLSAIVGIVCWICLICCGVAKKDKGWGWFYEHSFKEYGPNYSIDFLNKTLGSRTDLKNFGASPREKQVLDDYVTGGVKLSAAADHRGEQLAYSGITLKNSPRSHMLFFNPAISDDIIADSRRSAAVLATTKLILNDATQSSQVTPNTFVAFLESLRTCTAEPQKGTRLCRPSKFRSADGSCNNLKHPEWGQAKAPYSRLIKPRYGDGLFSMPKSVSGADLPNARLISSVLFPNREVLSSKITYLGMQWGQIITHDLGLLTMETTEAAGGIMCCKNDFSGPLPAELQHHACIPIVIPTNDPFYAPLGIGCLNMVRSLTAPRDDCSLGPAEQMNAVTAYMDGSLVYGKSPEMSAQIRAWVGGKLKVGPKRRLPRNPHAHNVCDFTAGAHECYLAGDIRVNQSPPLTLIQTLLLREHNHLANELSRLNPHWLDQNIYQNARAILIAQIQHITYYHWLPIVLGWKYVLENGITPLTLYSQDYGESINAGTLNEFSTVAFRFLHSQIPSQIHTKSRYGNITQTRLSDTYFNPNLMDNGPDALDSLIRGICSQAAQQPGHISVADVSNLLFRSTKRWGFDLMAFDIHRGRDHGIASYNDYRVICGLKRAKKFQDLSKEISTNDIETLSSLYSHVDDIDLYVGGSLETSLEDSLLGPTFQCIIGEQFYRTRTGDRYFYCLGGQNHSFTEEQLIELKKSSMARIIINNSDNIDRIQLRPFEMVSKKNPILNANEIPKINLIYWKEFP